MTEEFSYIPRLTDEQQREQYAQEIAFMLGTPGLTPTHIEGTGDEIMQKDGTIVKKEKLPVDPAAERRSRPKQGESYEEFLARMRRLHTGVAQPSWIIKTKKQG